jgi:hypothetical protein
MPRKGSPIGTDGQENGLLQWWTIKTLNERLPAAWSRLTFRQGHMAEKENHIT